MKKNGSSSKYETPVAIDTRTRTPIVYVYTYDETLAKEKLQALNFELLVGTKL